MDNKNNEWFGIVRWCNEDIASALEDKGIKATEENVNKIRKALENSHWFIDFMIEQGWQYIYETIDDEL